jgi:hypothetical protein
MNVIIDAVIWAIGYCLCAMIIHQIKAGRR